MSLNDLLGGRRASGTRKSRCEILDLHESSSGQVEAFAGADRFHSREKSSMVKEEVQETSQGVSEKEWEIVGGCRKNLKEEQVEEKMTNLDLHQKESLR